VVLGLNVCGGPPERRTATLQACDADLHKQCAVRELNPNPLIRTTQLWTVMASCGNPCATTGSAVSHCGEPVVGCGWLWLIDVAKSVCDGDGHL